MVNFFWMRQILFTASNMERWNWSGRVGLKGAYPEHSTYLKIRKIENKKSSLLTIS